MLTELKGKGGCLCQPAKQGELRCPLIVRPTSEDVITGHVFQTLRVINARHWLPQLLNGALRAKRFRQQCFRKLRIELWSNQPAYPPELLPWKEGSTQVDAVITWENPPTTVFIEAKYKAPVASRSQGNDGRSGFPSDQLTRNVRVGLFRTGYFEQPSLFHALPRDFVMILFSPTGQHELVANYRDPQAVLKAIPHNERIHALPQQPFVGQLSYPALIQILRVNKRWLTRPERLLAMDLVEYLEFKLKGFAIPERMSRQLDLSSSDRQPSDAFASNPP